jgi:hypothetical protein
MTRGARAGLTIVLLATALAACSGGGGQPAPPTTAANTGSVAPTATPPGIEGTWRTEPRSRQMVADALKADGLQQWVKPFLALPASDGVSDNEAIMLRISATQWTAYRVVGSTAPNVNDRQTATIQGDTITVRPADGGATTTTYRWTVVGDRLSLTLVSSTGGEYKGIPEEVFQRAFYTVTPFQRTTL